MWAAALLRSSVIQLFNSLIYFVRMQNLQKTLSTESSPLRRTQTMPNPLTLAIQKLSQSQQLCALSQFNVELSPTFQKKLTVQMLISYTERIVKHVYNEDPLGVGTLITQFLAKGIGQHRQRIQERLSLLKYLGESLKFKQFGQIEVEVRKEWRKNVVFVSINQFWMIRMEGYKFTSVEQFTNEYKKHVQLVANLTYFYFNDTLAILDSKNVSTFSYLRQDTAHFILNSLPGWKNLYNNKLLPLLKKKNLREQQEMNMDFDPRTLHINSHYLDLQTGEPYFLQTIGRIREFSVQHTIHRKITLLKEIRAAFIKEIEDSRREIACRNNSDCCPPLEKDDIISCMIYCIISGQIYDVQPSIQAINELLGPNNELLSRKGVDSYRADIQSAMQYLCEQSEPYIITIPSELQPSQNGI